MKPFILNRIDERQSKSTARIVLYAFLFYMITWGLMMLPIAATARLYLSQWGINPQAALDFLGDPNVTVRKLGWWALLQILIYAPILEEAAFRLGLSFRRTDMAIGLGTLSLFTAGCFGKFFGVERAFWFAPIGVIVGGLVWWLSAPGFWEAKRERWQRPMMWLSAALFGLVHLVAMSGLTWALLPYALLICLMVAFHACAFVYLRVNLGFWWAVGGHAANNLMGAVVIIYLLLK